MKKLTLTIIFLISALFIFTYLEKSKVKAKDNALTFSWDHYRKDKLTTITATKHGVEDITYTIKKENGIWSLVEPISITIFQEKTLALVNAFLTLTPSSILTNIAPEDMYSYGLNIPAYKIAGVFDGETNEFIIGDKARVGDNYYVVDKNRPDEVYLVSEKQLVPFILGLSALVNNDFLTKSTEELTQVSFKNNEDVIITLSNDNQMWIQTSPTTNNQADWGARKFLLSLRDLSFDVKTLSFDITEENLSELGITKDKSKFLELIFDNNNTNTYIFGDPINKMYPVYSSHEQIIAYVPVDVMDVVFGARLQDFVNRNAS